MGAAPVPRTSGKDEPKRNFTSVEELIVGPVREHSRKCDKCKECADFPSGMAVERASRPARCGGWGDGSAEMVQARPRRRPDGIL